MKEKAKKFWREHIRPLLVLMVALFSVRSAVADWNTVPTGSMKPTILEGDRIWVNKLAYGLKVPFTTYHMMRWSRPQRGEIVVFFSPANGVRLVKRVVGMPGDKIQMIDDQLIVNGKAAEYAPLDSQTILSLPIAERPRHEYAAEKFGSEKHPVMATPGVRAMRNFGPVSVPAAQYFMLGDNRDNSADSRYIGFVPEDSIVGRSTFVVLSLDYDGYYLPRKSRWFRALP